MSVMTHITLKKLLLAEASAKEIEAGLRRKFPGPEHASTIDAIVSSNNPPALWPVILRLAIQSKEPVAQVLTLVGAYNRAKQKLQKKDLAQYKDVQELQAAVESLAPSRSDVKGQVDKVYEDEHFLVVYPHSKEASCVWGKGTTWCTARTQSTNYFPYYAGAGNKLYYLITKGIDPQEDPKAKLSLGFSPDGKFSGGQDGGLSVDANNGGITMSDVIDQLSTRVDDATVRKIIATIKNHVTSSGDHPLKGFYDKALKDPMAHRRFFDEAFNATTPEPYVAMLLFIEDAGHSISSSYPEFRFDVCVYLNQLFKKFGVENEAIQELASVPLSVYSQFPDDIDQSKLSQYIQDALWLVDLDNVRLYNAFKFPVIKNVNSVPMAMRILESGKLTDNQMAVLYEAKFLNQREFHKIIREYALDDTLPEETRAPYIAILEAHAHLDENTDAISQLILHHYDYVDNAQRLIAWFHAFNTGYGTKATPEAIDDVIRNLIIPNIPELAASNRPMTEPNHILEKMMEVAGTGDVLLQSFDPLYELYFAMHTMPGMRIRVLNSLSDRLIMAGIETLTNDKLPKVLGLIEDSIKGITPTYAGYVVSDVIEYVAKKAASGPDHQNLTQILRKVAEIARRTYEPKANEPPSYTSGWWNSPALPPEYAPMRSSILQQYPDGNVRWPWPPPEPTQPQTLAEILFRRI